VLLHRVDVADDVIHSYLNHENLVWILFDYALASCLACDGKLRKTLRSAYSDRFRLSDLRESGSIEQDADVVRLLVRPKF
jgi:hypothetical protein